MRLGAPIYNCPADDPSRWALMHRNAQYGAAYCPVNADTDEALCRAYVETARKADLVIAEVGAWSNPLSDDPKMAQDAMDRCQKQLALAEKIGAKCCVNIAGSRNPKQWDGPHPTNFSADTFDRIVETVRKIIDAVKPARTFYTLEPMPWVLPDSPDNYLQLIKAIDRKAFAVHLDPVNMINCPARMYDTAGFLRECFEKLGRHIVSCHAKDITYSNKLTLHLDECLPGTGVMDYAVFLTLCEALDPNMPVMLEHLPKEEDYRLAADFVKQKAKAVGVSLR